MDEKLANGKSLLQDYGDKGYSVVYLEPSSKDWLRMNSYSKPDGKQVICVRANTSTGESEMLMWDDTFWQVTIDGQPMPPGHDLIGMKKVKLEANMQNRSMTITTK